MYNRYVPQADGSFQKQKLQEPQSAYTAPLTTEAEISAPAVSCAPLHDNPPQDTPDSSCDCSDHTQEPAHPPEPRGLGQFLKSLFPQGLDSEDLIVILLLLLISGDKGKDGNSALFTLGAYLFLC